MTKDEQMKKLRTKIRLLQGELTESRALCGSKVALIDEACSNGTRVTMERDGLHKDIEAGKQEIAELRCAVAFYMRKRDEVLGFCESFRRTDELPGDAHSHNYDVRPNKRNYMDVFMSEMRRDFTFTDRPGGPVDRLHQAAEAARWAALRSTRWTAARSVDVQRCKN